MIKTRGKDEIINKIVVLCCLIVVVITNIASVQKMFVPSILYDEMGYWISAAFFSGENWSGITSVMSYFSYGIGMFFSFFIKLISNPILVYKAIMTFNTLLMCVAYLIAYNICVKIFEKVNRNICAIIALISISYSTFLMNSWLTWAEHYLMVLFWVNIWLWIKIVENPSIILSVIQIFIVCCLYQIHQRCITIIFASICIYIFMYIYKKISLLHLGIVLLLITLEVFLNEYMKDLIIHSLWIHQSKGESALSNNYSGRLEILLFCLKNKGIWTIVESFIGKIFYLIISTYGIWLISIIKLKNAIKENLIERKENKNNAIIIIMYFIFLAILGFNILVNMSDGVTLQRVDSLVYGRYMEWAIGPILLLGLGQFVQDTKYSKKCLFYNIAVILFSTIYVYYIYQQGLYSTNFFEVCAGGVAYFLKITGGAKEFVLLAGLVVVAVTLAVYLVKRYIYFAFAIWILCFLFNGYYLREGIIYSQNYHKNMIEIAKKIEEHGKSKQIYYVLKEGDREHIYALIIQFLLQDYDVEYVTIEKTDYQKCYIMTTDFSSFEGNFFEHLASSFVGIDWVYVE